MLKNMSFAKTLSLGFGIILILLIFVGTISFNTINNASSNYVTYRELARDTNLMARVQANMLMMRMNVKDFIINGGDQTLETYEQYLELTKEYMAQAQQHIQNPERVILVDKADDALQTYIKAFEKVKRAKQDRNDLVFNHLNITGPLLENTLTKILVSAERDNDTNAAFHIGLLMKHLLLGRLYAAKFLDENTQKHVNRVHQEFQKMQQQLAVLDEELEQGERREWLHEVIDAENEYVEKFDLLVQVIFARNYTIKNTLDMLGPEITDAVEETQLSVKAEQDALGPKIQASNSRATFMILTLVAVVVIFGIVMAIITIRKISRPIMRLVDATRKVEQGDYSLISVMKDSVEMNQLSSSFNAMLATLKKNQDKDALKEWSQTGQVQLSALMRETQTLEDVSRNIITFLAKFTDADIGAFYSLNKNKRLQLTGSYAFSLGQELPSDFALGEGIVGQSALDNERILLTEVPDNYAHIRSALGESTPFNVVVTPVARGNTVFGVIELGAFKPFSSEILDFLDVISETLAITIQATISRHETQTLLLQTQQQAEQLQAREEELRESNEILEVQSVELEKNAAELEEKNIAMQLQQEKLKGNNEELENSQAKLEEQNQALDITRTELEQKAHDLTVSSKYKSEFLANMSHELRTPLNSVLILAKMLSNNKEQNLTDKQVEYADTIHNSGSDLLTLINDILDLSKIEAGHMEVNVETVRLSDFARDMQRQFQPLADKNNLDLIIKNTVEEDAIKTDGHKLAQIIRNLFSNAFKFTERGSITLTISAPSEAIAPANASDLVQFEVADTGIGIPEEKQQAIFNAFQQADGKTNRQYGGTGLGLSISKELTRILGGSMHLVSEQGKGSRFIVLVKGQLNRAKMDKRTSDIATSQVEKPLYTALDTPARLNTIKGSHQPSQLSSIQANTMPANMDELVNNTSEITDDRRHTRPEDKSLLIVDDDITFSTLLADMARHHDFKVLVVEDGETGLYFADYYKPSCIILDIGLPNIDGWQVMSRLKDNLDTRHIPVFFMSGHDKTVDAFQQGAVGYLTKPVSEDVIESTFQKIETFISKPVKQLLIVEDNKAQREHILDFIKSSNTEVDVCETGKETLEKLQHKKYDCIVLDLGLPDVNGIELLEAIRSDNSIEETPLIIYSAKELDNEEKAIVAKFANSVVIKNARSPELLLDNIALFLHEVADTMPEEQKNMMRMLHDNEAVFRDRNVLVVDDDMRNVFALTTMLRDKDINVITAVNGIDALEKLEQMASPDMVLMDIMMPEMDGYEAMRKIREQDCYRDLPIIALTAKAMKGDRSKCIKAGANDYLSKPIDTDKLLSMMRVWLYR